MATATKISTVHLADLIFDLGIYPRHRIDSSHVSEMVRTLEAGNKLPLPIVDAGTMKVVDGFHRVTALRRHLGPGAETDVELRAYDNEADLLADSVRLNAGHGRKLDVQDRARSALLLQRAGMSIHEISLVLHTTPGRVVELTTARIVNVQEGGKITVAAAKPVAYPGANGVRTLTPKQYAVMRSASGYRTAQVVTQLTNELASGLVDLTAPGLVDKLRLLAAAIDNACPKEG